VATQVFVYYRVPAADATSVIAAVRAFQAALQAQMSGLTCALSRRADEAPGPVTLMETYSHPDGIVADWRDRIEATARPALALWVVEERHVEVFVPCA